MAATNQENPQPVESQPSTQPPITPEQHVVVTPAGSASPTQEQETSSANKSRLPKLNIDKKTLKKLGIGLAIFVFTVLILAIVMRLLANRNSLEPVSTPTPTAEATASPTPTPNNSEYAQDPEISEIQQKIDSLESSLNSVDFREDTLSLPLLDWNVTFEK